MRVGTMGRASLLTVGQRVGCSGAYSARLDPQTERAQVERGPRNVSSVWVCARGDPLFRMIRIQAHLASQRV